MQSDIESGVSVVSAQSVRTLQPERIPASAESLSYLEALAVEHSGLRSRSAEEGHRRWQKLSPAWWHSALVLGDVVLLVLSFASVALLFLSLQWASAAFRTANLEIIWFCFTLLAWLLAVNITQAQKLNHASSRLTGPCCVLFALVLVGIASLCFAHFLLGFRLMLSVRLELLFLALATPTLLLWRFLFAVVKGFPRFYQQAVIVGINPAGQTLVKELRETRRSNITVIGYIDENSSEKISSNGPPALGDRRVLHHLTSSQMIDMIIIALDYSANPELCKEAIQATQLGISVIPMPEAYESCTGKIPVEHVGDQWYAMLPLRAAPTYPLFYLCWKKALDLACGIGGLFILGLLLPLIALLIALDSPGPIFYSQQRIGLRGKPFRIYKFRSMRQDSENEGAMWAAASDSRVTRVGRFLRSTHIDELPQLFNIVRGEMSLIGPRPERAEFVAQLEQIIPFYRSRLAVKPGLTGWAQVKYHYARSDNDALIKLQYDLFYIKWQSFMLDLSIILRTVFEVLSLSGS